MTIDDLDFLRALLIFEKLPDATFEGLMEGASLQRYPPHTLLFSQGAVPDCLYVVIEGLLELFTVTPDGLDTIIEVIDTPNAYTLAPGLTSSPYLVSGRVLRPGRILILRAEVLRRWAVVDIQLATNLMGLLASQFRMMVRQVMSLKLKSAAERLGCYIVALGEELDTGPDVALPYDKRRLAARLGMTPVSLSRSFARLADVGVDVQGRRVTVTDMARLRDFCKPDDLMAEVEEVLRVAAD